MSTERTMIACSSEIGIANFQIGSIFIHKPEIWVLNNYSRAEWEKEKLYPLESRKSDYSSQPIKILQWVNVTLLVPFAVLGIPTKGYQKSGTVRYFGTIHNSWK